jgi:hypothetical protein
MASKTGRTPVVRGNGLPPDAHYNPVMDADRAIALLRKRLTELQELPADRESQDFDDWRERTVRTLDHTVARAWPVDDHLALQVPRRRGRVQRRPS